MDDFTVVLRARALGPRRPNTADATATATATATADATADATATATATAAGAGAGAGAGALDAPLRVIAGAAELGVAWEPLLSSLAYRGETAVFEVNRARGRVRGRVRGKVQG